MRSHVNKGTAPLADKSADLPAHEISETPVDFSSVKTKYLPVNLMVFLTHVSSFPCCCRQVGRGRG